MEQRLTIRISGPQSSGKRWFELVSVIARHAGLPVPVIVFEAVG